MLDTGHVEDGMLPFLLCCLQGEEGMGCSPSEGGDHSCPLSGGSERLPMSSVHIQGWKESVLIAGGLSYRHPWSPGCVLLSRQGELRGCVTLWAQPASFG